MGGVKIFFFNLFLAALDLCCCEQSFSSCPEWGLLLRHAFCGGFSWCRARAFGARASVVVAHRLSSCDSRALERRLRGCGAWVVAHALCSMWDLPGPGMEPVPPALAGGFLTTAPPGKSRGKDLKPIIQSTIFLLESFLGSNAVLSSRGIPQICILP